MPRRLAIGVFSFLLVPWLLSACDARVETAVEIEPLWRVEGPFNNPESALYGSELEDINKGFDLMQVGESIRSVVVY